MFFDDIEKLYVQYIFLDVVEYTAHNIEEQHKIINELNKIVSAAAKEFYWIGWDEVRFLPTGDGMCIALEDEKKTDGHVKLAIKILELLSRYNAEPGAVHFHLRMGINENVDIAYDDINDRRNFAGRGINFAQRVMSTAGPEQIAVGQSVYERLTDTKEYHNLFKEYRVTFKRGRTALVYQYVNPNLDYLNNAPLDVK